jgi:hypothetical protein
VLALWPARQAGVAAPAAPRPAEAHA